MDRQSGWLAIQSSLHSTRVTPERSNMSWPPTTSPVRTIHFIRLATATGFQELCMYVCVRVCVINSYSHDDVIKWRHFPCYWPFVRGFHRTAVESLHNDQWRGALMFSLICAWTDIWANNRDAGDLRRYCTHYDVTVVTSSFSIFYGGQ